jgi:Fe-S-cluster containining protein
LYSQPDGFKCLQCGRCCREYSGTIQATEKDLERWKAEKRKDILKWVSPVDFGDHIEYDFPIHPATDDDVDRCPFLRKLPNKEVYICRIHNTKPEDCVKFPVSRQHGEDMGCPGIVNVEKYKP